MYSSGIFMVSGLTLCKCLSWIHFCVWYKAVVQFYSLAVWVSSFPNTIFRRDCSFSIVYSCLLCCRLIDHKCVGLFLGFLFYSSDLHVFCQYHTISVCLWYSLKLESMILPTLFFFLKIALAILSSVVPYKF